MQTSSPDSDQLDTWLAGDLPDGERKSLEQNLAAPDGEIGGELLHDLDLDRPEKDADLTALIDQLKTQSPDANSAPADDAWRAILAPTDDPNLIGTLGDYDVIEIIATGGMGIVFKARDPELDRVVAIKALDPELAANSTARERFLREARAAAKLEHENILPIHGVHEADGVPYFAMRLAAGGSLQDALDSGEETDIDRLSSIATGVAQALDAAHAAGIIHRDIKPANILFDETGEQIWVCDFGIARSTEDPSLTYSGAVAGTPQYMAPEQADGEKLDGRTDLFSLGAVLYRCATGKQAFAGNTTAAVLKNVATVDPDLTDTNLPKWFANLIGNLLAKAPADRPADANAVLRAIDRQHSPRPKRTRRHFLIAAAGIAAVATIALVSLPRSKPSPSPQDNEALDLAALIAAAEDGSTILLDRDFEITDPIVAPSGRSITLRAAPGTRPVITSALYDHPALTLTGPSTLTGLHFERHNPGRGAAPMLAIHADGGHISIEDCRFTSNAPTGQISRMTALAVSHFNSADITRCQFDIIGGHCIRSGPDSGKLVIESCFLVGAAAYEHRSDSNDPRTAFTLRRSVVLSGNLIENHPGFDFAPLDVQLSENIVYLLNAGFDFADVPPADIAGLFTWDSRDNHYRANVPFVITRRVSAPRGFRATRIIDGNSPLLAATTLQERRPHFGETFDLTAISWDDFSPGELLGRLAPSVDSPAKATLKHFADRVESAETGSSGTP